MLVGRIDLDLPFNLASMFTVQDFIYGIDRRSKSSSLFFWLQFDIFSFNYGSTSRLYKIHLWITSAFNDILIFLHENKNIL